MLDLLRRTVKTIRPAYRTLSRIRGIRLHEPTISIASAVYLGSSYGGWQVDVSGLKSDSIVYSAGVGDDISFDLALIDTIGCRIYAPDPTPNAIEWIKRQNVPSEFQFIPIGLSGSEGILDFHVPARKDLDCFSRTPVAGAKLTGVVQCPVTTIPQLMTQLNHDHIDLLKMDIEGFEYEVLDQMLCAGVRPMQIAVEFHHLQYGHSAQQTIGAVEGLKRAGYGLHWVSDRGNEYGFVLRSQLS